MNFVPSTEKQRDLAAGDFYFGQGDLYLRTLLGSCVAITVWHAKLRIGGMSHCLLPDVPANGDSLNALYVPGAVKQFCAGLWRYGASAQDCVTKLFGGGNMFPEQSAGLPDVGRRNVESARYLLCREGFRVSAEHVGENDPLVVILDLNTGDTWLRAPISPEGS